jgi:hypothetical protein
MANPKMVILRGNSAKAGKFPDEKGNYPAWPIGALHVKAAEDYAKRLNYDPITLPIPGDYPQSADTEQSKAALKTFREDELVCAFYGFSGGGYNLRWMLEALAKKEPQLLHRIDRIIVIGAPNEDKVRRFLPARYNAMVSEAAKGKDWKGAKWDPLYRENPDDSQMPKGTEGFGNHMFGPDVLLTGWPE